VFVKDIAENTGSLNIVRAVAALANEWHDGHCEGVETGNSSTGLHPKESEMQGFLFSQPSRA